MYLIVSFVLCELNNVHLTSTQSLISRRSGLAAANNVRLHSPN